MPPSVPGPAHSQDALPLLDEVAGRFGQQVAILLNVVRLLAVGLLAVHDVAVVVAHSASGLQERLGQRRVVEAGLWRHAWAVQLRHQRQDCRRRAELRPAIVAVPVVAHFVRLLQGRAVGDGQVRAVPLEEAVAAIQLVDAVVLVDGPLVLDLAGLYQVFLIQASVDVWLVLGRHAPSGEVCLAVRRPAKDRARRHLHRAPVLAVEWLLAERGVLVAVELRVQKLLEVWKLRSCRPSEHLQAAMAESADGIGRGSAHH
mmetsp:Transcript_82684/g.250756  ORF Transcript_82684/g.250756 Transcript_82684/m.250756 type:complete len:258 (-) Transcript_82684:169-942(-)